MAPSGMAAYRPSADDPFDQMLVESGYVWCRPHEEWHRPPECPINQQGHPLMTCGCVWDDVDQTGQHRVDCAVFGGEHDDPA